MDIEKWLKMHSENEEEFMNLDYLIPLDDVIEYNGKKYKLAPNFKKSFSEFRGQFGYDFYYTGKVENKHLTRMINLNTILRFLLIKRSIELAIEFNKTGLCPEIKE